MYNNRSSLGINLFHLKDVVVSQREQIYWSVAESREDSGAAF